MKTVVSVSAVEVVRMVATLVLARPENSGRAVGSVEMHSDERGITELRVVTFDSPDEAKQHVEDMGQVQAPSGPRATVLALVQGAPSAAAQVPASDPP